MLPRSDRLDFLLLYNFNTFPQQTPPTLLWWKAWRRSQRQIVQRRKQQEEETRSLLSKVPWERIIFLLREPPLDKVVEAHTTFYQAPMTLPPYQIIYLLFGITVTLFES